MELYGVVLVALITAVIGPTILEVVKKRLSEKKNHDPIRTEVEHSKIIHEELDDIRDLFKSDRVWITMYHNGG